MQVIGWPQPDGSINAAQIETKNPNSAGGPEHPGNSGNHQGSGDNGQGNGNGNGNDKGGKGD